MEKMKTICRGCMSTNTNEFENFFDNQLSLVYQSLTNLQATFDDGLPHVICIQCKKHLENYQHFKDQCIRSYNELKLNQEIVKTECEQIIHFKTEYERVTEDNEDYFDETECLTYTET